MNPAAGAWVRQELTPHDGNLFGGVRRPLVIDWGDAVLAHPFGTLLVTLDVLAYQLDCVRIDPGSGGVQEAYLEVWRTGGVSRADLAVELDLAIRTAGLGRRRPLAGRPADALADAASLR